MTDWKEYFSGCFDKWVLRRKYDRGGEELMRAIDAADDLHGTTHGAEAMITALVIIPEHRRYLHKEDWEEAYMRSDAHQRENYCTRLLWRDPDKAREIYIECMMLTEAQDEEEEENA